MEVMVVGCGGAAGLKKLGTIGPVAVVEGSDFVVVGAGEIAVAGLAKKFGTAGWADRGTVFEVVGVGAGTGFFGGSLIPVVVVISVGGFDCAEAKEAGVDEVGIMVPVVVVVAGAGEGFLSCSAAFFVS